MGPEAVRVALAGLGGYGSFYAEKLLGATPERAVRLVAGVDPEPKRSAHFEALLDAEIPIYPSLETFFRQASADLVVVAAPIQWHTPLACLALSRGASVLCEKPLSATIQQAKEMAQAEREAARFVAVGYQWSFSDAVQALKRDVMAGMLGRPVRLRTAVYWPRTTAYYRRNAWAGQITSADGKWVLDSPVSNATAHYLHNMLYILGSTGESSAWPVDIQAELYRANAIENYDTAALRCHTREGTEILFYAAHPVPREIGPLISYEFEHAIVEYGHGEGTRFIARFHDGRVRDYGDPNSDHSNKLWQSLDAVRTGQQIACGIAGATPHVLCVNGAQESVTDPTPIPARWVRTTNHGDGTSLVWVEGLQEALEQCFSQGVLPAEIGAVPWAAGGRTVDLEGYDYFPSARVRGPRPYRAQH